MKTTIILLLLPALLFAQEFTFELETSSIPVEMEEWMPYCPWAGGESESVPEFCDINADGDLDFFLGNFWGWISYIENLGTYYNPDYSFQTWRFAEIDLSGNTFAGRTSPKFCDIDGDGDSDLFSGDFRGLIHFWENVGTPELPEFNLITDTLAGIDADGYSKLDFIDIDLEGDFDIILGDYFGEVWLYTNSGSPSLYNFSTPPAWVQNIDVGNNAFPKLIDIDADNDYDLFIGERYGKIWYYRNDGDSVNYDFTFVTDNFYSIDVGNYSSPEFADIDGDGDFDLFVGKENNSEEPLGDVYYYENIGTAQNADFILRAKNYLMVDIGGFSPRPQIADIDNDGAKDLITGISNHLDLFSNNGDSAEPSFLFVTEEFQNIQVNGITPFFVDIDADDDLDLFAGQSVIPGPPSLALYLNEGTVSHPNLQLYNSQFLTNPDFFVGIVPVLVDIDADNDFDLFITDDYGHFFYYQNEGSVQWPNFQWQSSQWQGLQFDGTRPFYFSDMDEDNDLDLFVASSDWTNISFYRNVGNPQSPNMQFEIEELFPDLFIVGAFPYLADIDDDQDYDLFSGAGNGGLLFFRNTTGDTAAVQPRLSLDPLHGIHFTLGPNPANPITWISYNLPYPQKAEIAVYNLLGQKVTTLVSGLQMPGQKTLIWDAANYSSGQYFIRMETDLGITSDRVTVVK
ncbi:T9SS type A sorting domain-containing protein [bacterium]|nr:T9SS type A sorting domain-containing protein [bacterium]